MQITVVAFLLSAILLSANPTSALAGDDLKSLTPYAASRMWNMALSEGDIALAGSLTSKSGMKDVKERFGSLDGLSDRYRKRKSKTSSVLVRQEIIEDRAIVVSRIDYGGKKVAYYLDMMIREDGVWKMASEHAQSISIKK